MVAAVEVMRHSSLSNHVTETTGSHHRGDLDTIIPIVTGDTPTGPSMISTHSLTIMIPTMSVIGAMVTLTSAVSPTGLGMAHVFIVEDSHIDTHNHPGISLLRKINSFQKITHLPAVNILLWIGPVEPLPLEISHLQNSISPEIIHHTGTSLHQNMNIFPQITLSQRMTFRL